jgi:hypothetical protein
MYSFSDAEIAHRAHRRGRARRQGPLPVRDRRRSDKNISDLAARTASKSGKLEKAGVDVRWVNKILHHKFVIVDGPRDDAGKAATAKLATGSANWSFGGSSIYDENTLFISGYRGGRAGLPARVRPAVVAARATSRWPTADRQRVVLDDRVPDADRRRRRARRCSPAPTSPHRPPARPRSASTSTKTLVADQWVAAINARPRRSTSRRATLRLRPVALALIAKKQANPSLDIQVLLDQQEFISATADNAQRAELEDCLTAAGADATAQRACTENDFLYGRMIGQAGIPVRYKSYATAGTRPTRADAQQVHDRRRRRAVHGQLQPVDERRARHVRERAAPERRRPTPGRHRTSTRPTSARCGTYNASNGTARRRCARRSRRRQTIPLVFTPMALTWQAAQRPASTLIRANCTQADSTDFRTNPAAHKYLRPVLIQGTCPSPLAGA